MELWSKYSSSLSCLLIEEEGIITHRFKVSQEFYPKYTSADMYTWVGFFFLSLLLSQPSEALISLQKIVEHPSIRTVCTVRKMTEQV